MSDAEPPTSRRAAREAETVRLQAAAAQDATPPATLAPMPISPLPLGALPPVGDGPPQQFPPQQPLSAEPPRPPLRPTRLQLGIIIGAAIVIFALLCTGSVFLGIRSSGAAAVPATSPGGKTPKRVVPADQVQPTAIPTCSIDSLVSNAALVKVSGSVVETAGGTSLYSRNDTIGAAPAAVLKVLTGAAAIAALGPTFQITTSVDETTPGTIVLIGNGDATLSRVASGQSVYAGAPTLASLASKTMAAYNANAANAGIPITNIILDSTYWSPTDNWDSSWPRTLQTGGYLSEVTALQVDGDRANPHSQISPRSADPVTAAGNAFVSALGLAPGSVTLTKAAVPTGAAQLASVQSQPMSTLVKQMLLNNDDTLAEMLARIVSIKENLGGTSGSIQQAMTTALAKDSVDTTGLTIEDGSGESDESQLPPLFMSTFMTSISMKSGTLQYIAADLPVSGKTGNLANRFTGSNSVVVGKITGFAGAQTTAYTLSGYLTAADGTGESFTFFAEGQGITSKASPVLDSLATAVYKCGKNITNN